MTARAYFVDGVALVNTGGELCESCGKRKAVGPSISGSLLCVVCIRQFTTEADEFACEALRR